MAQSASQRLRKAAQKAAQRKSAVAQKRKAEAAQAAGAPGREIAAALGMPISICVATDALFELGIGWVILGRALPSGSVAASLFLVDVWCLGIKRAISRRFDGDEFRVMRRGLSGDMPMSAMAPPVARQLLHEAAAYGSANGLPPHKDYALAEALFGDTPLAGEVFAFGRDGKPQYVSGPNDSPARIRQIMAALGRRLGPDGFEYMIATEGIDMGDWGEEEDDDEGPVIEHQA